jgi:prepilin-type N-terminal cleavage/methylation domain-containing protein
MKMNTSIRKAPKGVTLIELSVVIAVILVLISVLFVGASYYRSSANEAACAVNRSSIEKAADSYMNIEELSTVTLNDIQGAGTPFPNNIPACPDSGTYSISVTNGDSSVACTVSGHS